MRKVTKITTEEASDFLSQEHRDGNISVNQSVVSYGLFVSQELIGVAVFGPTRTSAKKRDYSFELYRLAFKRNKRAYGGVSQLIKHFIRDHKPADFFTYQDTTGENTLAYQYSGMTRVQDGLKLKKGYLVAPGKTIETGSRKEVLGMAYATRYGPDRILGTKLGEVLREDGSRKSNKDIFLEELGWHLEETTGDSVWEWIDPDRTYYTYKITASDSDKYYYGVSHVKKANASVEDCLNDGYYGSGGVGPQNKFYNWKKLHQSKIHKEIIELFPRKAWAFRAEEELIGDRYRLDKLCLNSTVGGSANSWNTSSLSTISMRECVTHGLVKHRGQKCVKCVSANSTHTALCETHGEGLFIGVLCLKCRSASGHYMQHCENHGETVYKAGKCKLCSREEKYSERLCETHGMTVHYGSACCSCLSQKSLKTKICKVHGETTFRGESCGKCASSSKNSAELCSVHGDSIFVKGVCAKCHSAKMVTIRECRIHGEAKHSGKTCIKCVRGKSISLRNCDAHGETKYRGDTCIKCKSQASVALEECLVHGLSKHRGGTCFRCSAVKRSGDTP